VSSEQRRFASAVALCALWHKAARIHDEPRLMEDVDGHVGDIVGVHVDAERCRAAKV
jgi:hypothetical protein